MGLCKVSQSMYLHLCVLSMFMDLKPPEETLQENAALPANLTLPLTTEPGCSGECKLLISFSLKRKKNLFLLYAAVTR